VSRRVVPVSEVLDCVVGRAESIRITSPVAAGYPPHRLSLYTKAGNRGNGVLEGKPDAANQADTPEEVARS